MKPMDYVPTIEEERPSEAMLLLIDSSMQCDLTFNRVRETAFRLARNRLLYNMGKNDVLGLVQGGSNETNNKLATMAEGGYMNIEVQVPLVPASLRAINGINNMRHDKQEFNLLDILEVSGDLLQSIPAIKDRKKRLLIFTSYKSILAKGNDDENENNDFLGICKELNNIDAQVDIFIAYGKNVDEDTKHIKLKHKVDEYNQLFDEDGDEDEQVDSLPTPDTCFQKSVNYPFRKLISLCKCTGGQSISISQALALSDIPYPKPKRASAKFSGILNVGNILKIPVKRYTYTMEVKGPAGKEISWEESKKRNQRIAVLKDTTKYAEIKSDVELKEDEIINGYPYGPECIPINNKEDEEESWRYNAPKGLDVIGFIKQQSIDRQLLLSNVDILIPLKNCKQSIQLLNCLILALYIDSMAIIARYVSKKDGGPPSLCCIWPHLERNDRSIENFFLFIVQIPMREDIRDLPFASLNHQLNDVPDDAMDAMDDFISSSMLPNILDENNSDEEEDDDGDDESDGNEKDSEMYDESVNKLDVTKIPNPNLHWFNLSILHRIVNGVESTDYPNLSSWHSKLLKPSSYIRKTNAHDREAAIGKLKTMLPIHQARKKFKKTRRIHATISGEIASIGDFLPIDDSVNATNQENHNKNNNNDNNVQQNSASSVKNINDDDDHNIDNDTDEETSDIDNEHNNFAIYKAPGEVGNGDEEDHYEQRLSSHYNSVEHHLLLEEQKGEEENNKDQMSTVTDIEITDVSIESPIEDFELFIKSGKFRYGVKSLEIIIKRLIREYGNEQDKIKSMKCVEALRNSCIKEKEPKAFNDFISSMVSRCERKDIIGRKTLQFFQYVGQNGNVGKVLQVIPAQPIINKRASNNSNINNKAEFQHHNVFLNNISEKIKMLTSSKNCGTIQDIDKSNSLSISDIDSR